MSRMTFLAHARSHGLVWLFAGIAASGCATNPATGKNQLMLVSEDQEIAMGRQADSAVITITYTYRGRTPLRMLVPMFNQFTMTDHTVMAMNANR